MQVLASGSGGNAYWVSDGETPLLLEAGLTIAELRRRTRFRLSRVAGVLISHEHGDHAKAAKDLVKAGIDVYATLGTLVALNMASSQDPGHHRVHVVKAYQPFIIGTWAILPFEAVHDAEEPVSFLMASKHGYKLLYVTDSAYVKHRFNGLTHVMLEVNHSLELMQRNLEEGVIDTVLFQRVVRNHMSLERAVEMLKANDLSRVECIWLLHLSDANASAERFKTEIERATGKPVIVC